MKNKTSTMQISSGNIFEDLGLPNASELALRVRMGLLLAKAIRERQLTQTEMAALLRIPQSNVSALVNNRFEGFSLERLISLLARLEIDIDFAVREKPAADEALNLQASGSSGPSMHKSQPGACRTIRQERSVLRFSPDRYALALRLVHTHTITPIPRLA